MAKNPRDYDLLRLCVERTIEKIYTVESYLIDNGLSEWSVAAQFHYWMRRMANGKFGRYDFDSEYNHMRMITDVELARKTVSSSNGRYNVRPYFIVHKRGSPNGNLLWVEMKRHGGKKWENDLERVCAVTQKALREAGVEYITGYCYGLGVLFHKRKVTCKWFHDNQLLAERVGMRKEATIIWR